MTLWRNDGLANFSLAYTVPVGRTPRTVLFGDLDGDGDLDLAVANSNTLGSSGTVSIRFNNGVGVFGGTTELAAGNRPTGLALGDVDGDGDLDLVSGAEFGTDVQVRRNNGAVTFGGPTSIPTGGRSIQISLRDLDNDLDLITSNFNSGTISLRFNDGAGNFTGSTNLPVGAYTRAHTLTDVDNDGDLDLFATVDNVQTLFRFANDGTGTFTPQTGLYTVGVFSALTAADMNGDGYDDLVGPFSDVMVVYLNNQRGGYTPTPATVSTYFGPMSVAVGDFDNDGDLDTASANDINNLGTVCLNGGSGAPLATAARQPLPALRLAPVPARATEVLWVQQLPSTAQQVEVLDGLGRVVRSTPVGTGQQAGLQLPLAGLAPGLYSVRAGASVARLLVE